MAAEFGGFFVTEGDEAAVDAAEGPVFSGFDAELHFCGRHAAESVGDARGGAKGGVELSGVNEATQEGSQAGEPEFAVVVASEVAEVDESAEGVGSEIGG